jgi:hypothetical protein
VSSPGRTGSLVVSGATAVAALLLTGLVSVVPALAATPAGTVLFRLSDPRLDEVSGLAPGLASPGILYVQNDSGDSARVFALNARTGAVVAVLAVPDATNVDWEDIAIARDARGVPSLWIADIGDNDGDRSEVRLYRVDEPTLNPAEPDHLVTTSAPDVWRLSYPDGPRDAESLAVLPGGRAFVVSKTITGASTMYSVPARPDPNRVQVMSSVGGVGFGFTGTPGGPNPLGQVTATGASVASDGSALAIRTYTDAYIWPLPPIGAALDQAGADATMADVIKQKPVHLALPEQPQGEGIAIVGDQVLLDSEHVDSIVYAMPLPAGLSDPPRGSTTAGAPTRSPGPNGSGVTSKAAAAHSAPAVPASVQSDGHRSRLRIILSIIGALLVAAVVIARTVARRRR